MIELVCFVFLGILIGFFIGFIPAIHINSILPFLIIASNENLIALVVAASISFVFSSNFPSILFGVPSNDFLIILPSHKLVKNGKALKAIHTTLNSVLIAILFSFLMIPMLFLIKEFYNTVQQAIPFILIITLISFVFQNKKSILIIFLSGLLGYLTFGYNFIFPLLTGFFAIPNLIFSFNSRKLTPQFFEKINFSKKLIRSSFLASFLGSIFSIVPGISSSITATLAEKFGKLDDEEFISFVSATNAVYMVFSFYALSFLGISRSGSAVFLQNIDSNILFFSGIIFLSAGFSFLLSKKMSSSIVKRYQKLNQKLVSFFGIFLLILLSFFISDFIGLIILFTSSLIGIFCIILKVPRISCMSSLIIPTVLVML